MRPVIERIAQRVRDGARPGQKFVARISGAGDVSFRHAVRAHRAPFVVVAFEPRLEKIVEAAIGGDVGGRKMRVIIEDRFGRGVSVIEAARRFGLEKKVVVDEGHHGLREERYSDRRCASSRSARDANECIVTDAGSELGLRLRSFASLRMTTRLGRVQRSRGLEIV